MQIVERYLESVKKCLPKEQADDIIKELSENIASQIEDKETELGRNLSELEIEGILKQHGHPLIVASRYRREQGSVAFGQQLIGPALFPFYIRVLKFNLGLTSLVILVVFAALFAAGQPIGNVTQVLIDQLLIQFVIVTLIFWAMNKKFVVHPDRWDPRKPYAVRHPAIVDEIPGPRIPRAKSVSQFIGLLIAMVWLRIMLHAPFLVFGPAAAFLNFSRSWDRLYVPIVILIFIGMVSAAVTFVRPDWVRFHRAMRIARRAGGLVLCSLILRSGGPMVIATALENANASRVAQVVNQAFYYGVMFSAATFVVQIAIDLRRIVAHKTDRLAAGSAEQRI